MSSSSDSFLLKGRYADRYRWEVLTEAKDGSDSRPTAQSIIDDEGLRGKMTDKVFLVTGCSSGAGVATVAALVSTGATIFATARDLQKAKTILGSVLDENEGRVHLLYMEQTDFDSVHCCAAEFRKATPGGKLNVLICNAAIMAPPHTLVSEYSIESQFATNYLSHFLLFELLKDLMIASSTPKFNSRVVSVSSTAHRLDTVDFDDINYTKGRKYEPYPAYGQSKTACIWFANQIERMYGSQGLHANSLMPGGWESGLQKYSKEFSLELYKEPKVAKLLGTVRILTLSPVHPPSQPWLVASLEKNTSLILIPF